ncbi:major facilitator superfamily domain-containing protein [Mycena olivaceomarginata]|nr:major facilitator superfamily domain-containing protein [Mycena olivaceomarginata]
MFSSRSQVSPRHGPGEAVFYDRPPAIASEHGGFADENDSAGEDPADSIPRFRLPWWKRPSPWWLIIAVPFTGIAMSATLAPKVEVYTLIACTVHKPELLRVDHLPSGYTPDSVAPRHAPQPKFPRSFELTTNQSVNAMGGMSPSDASPCASDQVVQAAVAKLTTAGSALSGIISILTTAWWGAFSDRYGRTRVLALTVFGLLLSDLTFVFVAKNVRWLPGGYWSLLAGPILDGALGSMATATAATQAYLADTTHPADHSRIFALLMGVLFLGGGIGPMLGGLIVRWSGNPLSVFYLTIAVNTCYILLCLFVIPEALTKSQMQASSAQYREHQRILTEQKPTFANRIQRLFAFLEPLTIFFPERSPSRGRRWNYNLTFLALAYGSTVSIMGSMMVKFQFVASYFGWTSEHIGYYLSATGAVQALFLTVLLPLLIKLVKSYLARISESSSSKSHPLAFDLSLARISLFVEIIGYTAMPFAPSGLLYTAFTILASFGAGFGPAVQSVALELYTQKNDGAMEAGRLFGGLSVIQALAQIVGPSIYGLVYASTVSSFPKAIFFVSVASDCFSLFCVGFVRLGSSDRVGDEEADSEERERLRGGGDES